MTWKELSEEYRLHAEALSMRIGQLEAKKNEASLLTKEQIEDRIKMLSEIRDEANELSEITSGLTQTNAILRWSNADKQQLDRGVTQ